MSKTQTLIDKLQAAYQLFEPDTLGLGFMKSHTFQHYKGGLYQIEKLVVDTDDGEVRVLYYRVGGPDFDYLTERNINFVRPLSEWFDYVDGILRFIEIETSLGETLEQAVAV